MNDQPSTPPAHVAVKFDAHKPKWHLFPWDAARGIVQVLTFGAEKYGDRNWESGFAWSRLFSAMMRHMAAWQQGETADPETGMSHLWHAGCCLLMLIAHELRGIGVDDRGATVRQTRREQH